MYAGGAHPTNRALAGTSKALQGTIAENVQQAI